MSKRMRVVTSNGPAVVQKPTPTVVVSSENPKPSTRLTANEMRVRLNKRFVTTTTMGGLRTASDVMDSGTSNFYSPQLSTDFLEKPQNLRERRAFYRFFYNTNEIVGQAIDIHSTLPLSKLRLVPPKGKNEHQNKYVMRFFEKMCDNLKLFKTLIEISHEFNLFGNCVGRHATIRTPEGYKRADEIKEGDFVLTHEGRYRKVLKAAVRPAEELLNIKMWRDFRDLPLTEEHPVEVLDGDSFVFKQTGDLVVGDYVRVTWPATIEDKENAVFEFPSWYKKTATGYQLTFDFMRDRNKEGFKARKGLLSWLRGLESPVVKTREEVASTIGVSKVTLNGVIYKMDQELDVEFHKRIGASGFQKGSQVMWFPLQFDMSVSDEYQITKKIDLPSIDTIPIDNDFAYLAGYWLGDGTLARDNSRTTWGRGLWQICSKDS